MDFSFDLVSFLIGGVLAGVAAAVILMNRRRDENLLLAQFKALAQDTLTASQESLLTLAAERVKTLHAEAAHEADKRHQDFTKLVEPLQKGLTELDQRVVALDKAGAGLNEHLHLMAQSQRRLHDETSQLVQALRSPNIRGRWGELQLQRSLEIMGFVEGAHFKTQVTRRTKDGRDICPDCVIDLGEGRELIIDSKTPIEGYLEALREGISQVEQDAALQRHAKALRGHVAELAKRAYWEEFQGMDFVVLFVPSEAMLSAALAKDITLMEDATRARVVLASPLSLLALLRVIAYGRRQQQIADEAHKIAEVGSTLLERISGFLGHFDKIGRALETVNKSYNDSAGSLESRVLPQARKMQELGVRSKTPLPPELKLVEKTPRSVAINE